MAYVRHDQPTLAMYLKLANSQTIIGISEDNVDVGGASVLPPTLAKNTKVLLTALPDEQFNGEQETFFSRVGMEGLFPQGYLGIDVPQGTLTPEDIAQGLNSRLGLGLEAKDLVINTQGASEASVTFSDECYAYVGTLAVNLNRVDPDVRDGLSTVIADKDIVAFSDPLALDDVPMHLLERDVFQHNQLTAERNTIHFGVPLPNTDETHAGNTKIAVRTTDKGLYSGETTVYYDRLAFSDLFPDGLRIPLDEYDTLYSAFGYILSEYGVYLTELDVEDSDLTVENPVATAKEHSLILNAGAQIVIGEPIILVNSLQGMDGDPLLTMDGFPMTTIEDPNAPEPSPLEGITLTHQSAFDPFYNVGANELTTGTHSDGTPSLEGTSNLSGLNQLSLVISPSGGTFDAEEWEIGGEQMNNAVGQSAAWPVSPGQSTSIVFKTSSMGGGSFSYRWEYATGPIYLNPLALDPVVYDTLEDFFAGEGTPQYVVIGAARLVLTESTDPSMPVGTVFGTFGQAAYSSETGYLTSNDAVPTVAFEVAYPVE